MSGMTLELDNRFKWHEPKGDQQERYELLRYTASKYADLILTHTPASREQSLAITKLEEAMMWANSAIARNE